MLTTAFVPRANADTLFVYFNFEDPPGTVGRDAFVDNFADAISVGPDTGNTGGGTQASTITFVGGDRTTDTGLLLNRSTSARAPTNDLDTASPGSALTYNAGSFTNKREVRLRGEAFFNVTKILIT